MTYKEDDKKLAELCKMCGGRCCVEGDSITISNCELKKLKRNYNFKSGYIKSPYGKINTIKFSKNKPCPFIGKKRGRHLEIGCILKGRTRPLGCRIFPLTFLIGNGKLNFYLSTFCPYVKDASKLSKWIDKSIKDAKNELKTWTKDEKLTRTFLHKKIHKNHKYLIEMENGRY